MQVKEFLNGSINQQWQIVRTKYCSPEKSDQTKMQNFCASYSKAVAVGDRVGGSVPEKVVAAIVTPGELLELLARDLASRSDHHTKQIDISCKKIIKL